MDEADVLAVPVKAAGEKSTAYEIIRGAVDTEGKEILETVFPMVADQEVWRSCAAGAGEEIAKRLCEGKRVALITLGDVTVYSTCMYVQQYIEGKGFDTYLVPGISSYSAGAALAGVPLMEGSQSLAVVPAGREPGNLTPFLDAFDNLVIMKAGKCIGWLKEYMREHGIPGKCATMLYCVGMEEEYVGPLDEGLEYRYFTTVILKKG